MTLNTISKIRGRNGVDDKKATDEYNVRAEAVITLMISFPNLAASSSCPLLGLSTPL